MTPESGQDIERFRSVLGRRLGLSFDDGKLGVLRDALRARAGKARVAPSDYVVRLECAVSDEELGKLAQDLTVTETYFFRYREQLNAFSDAVLARRTDPLAPLRVLSAGCASGEEPYSLAMLLRQQGDEAPVNVSIVGIDVNEKMLEKASRARYSRWSLRETPPDVVQRWFVPEGREFRVDPSIRDMVRFERRNLIDRDDAFWRSGAFDVVLCRNVLMYFTDVAALAVTRRIAESLAPGGLFFLGHAETWRTLSRDFELCQTRDAFYYRRRDVLASEMPTPGFPPARMDLVDRHDWIHSIQRSTSRVTSLTAHVERELDASVSSHHEHATAPLDVALGARLVHEERFTELEHLLDEAALRSVDEPGLLLLRAILHTRNGDVLAAERACARLLALDVGNAGACYLLALNKESAGDRSCASEQHLLATQADPSFSMPQLHLGLLARRGGDVPSARRHLAHALALLEREDADRLLLFGGGFGRAALLELCRAELLACRKVS